jgi:hypothetical protein
LVQAPSKERCNGINSPLGCGVDRTGRDVELGEGGPDVDDASAVVAEELYGLAGNEKGTEDVGVEKTAIKLDVYLFNRGRTRRHRHC